MPESVIQIIITTLITSLAIPVTIFFFQRSINKADEAQKEEERKAAEAKKQEETNWRKSVSDMFTRIETKITNYCSDNHKEHEELYGLKNEISSRVSVIETVHHQRGCDQPIRRD